MRTLALDFDVAAFGRSNEDEGPTRQRLFDNNVDRDDRFILGAFDGHELVGISGMFRHDAVKAYHKGNIWSVFVVEEYQGKGLGRGLMEETIEQTRQIEGVDLILIGVSAYNTKAHELYKRLGFIDYGTEPRSLKIDGEYYAEHLMWMDLTL